MKLSDAQWEMIREHFPEESIPDGRAGRRPVPTRAVLEAVLWSSEHRGTVAYAAAVLSRLNRSGLDAVLVTNFFRREYQLIGNPNDPWNPANPEPYDIIQTNLYDVKTQRKIWSALSETWIKSMDSYVTSSIVGAVLKKLADDKFVK